MAAALRHLAVSLLAPRPLWCLFVRDDLSTEPVLGWGRGSAPDLLPLAKGEGCFRGERGL